MNRLLIISMLAACLLVSQTEAQWGSYGYSWGWPSYGYGDYWGGYGGYGWPYGGYYWGKRSAGFNPSTVTGNTYQGQSSDTVHVANGVKPEPTDGN